MVARVLVIALCVLAAPACGLDTEIFGAASDRGHVRLPDPRDTILTGRATPVAGGEVTFWTSAGTAIADASAVIGDDGVFVQRFPGTEEVSGLVLWGASGDRVVLGILPELPRQPTVFHEEHQIVAWEQHASLADLNAGSSAVAMVASAAARRLNVSLGSLDGAVVAGGLDDVVAALEQPGPVQSFAQMVGRIDAAAAGSASGEAALTREGLTGGGSFLRAEFLQANVVDYDADGVADLDTAAFDAALADAAATIELGVCYPEDRIRVVWHVDLRSGVRNRNCTEVDHYKWASPGADKRVFLAGGVHEDAPVCGPDRADHCLTEGEVDAVNEELGGWVPNVTPMYDDGTHGDAVAGDDVWTLALELPYIPTETSPDGAGVRLGYKYTLGLPGQGWTDAEEWPGNQRLLELEDLNGDRVVTRYDIFGDEAANKDKANALKLSLGGCGTIAWEAERDPECAGDSRENRVDTDGDCIPDSWDSTGPVGPITVPCE